MICPECYRLNNTFTEHVQRSIKLLAEYRIALSNRDEKSIARIQEMLPQEERLRKTVRQAIATHQGAHPPRRNWLETLACFGTTPTSAPALVEALAERTTQTSRSDQPAKRLLMQFSSDTRGG